MNTRLIMCEELQRTHFKTLYFTLKIVVLNYELQGRTVKSDMKDRQTFSCDFGDCNIHS